MISEDEITLQIVLHIRRRNCYIITKTFFGYDEDNLKKSLFR